MNTDTPAGVLQLSLMEILQMVIFPALALISWYFRDQISQLNKQIDVLEGSLQHQKTNNNQWQLQIVQNYVTKTELERLEQRILSALDRLSDKMEKALLRSHDRSSD